MGDVLESARVFHLQDAGDININIGSMGKINNRDLAMESEEFISDWKVESLLFVSVELGDVEVGFTENDIVFTVGDGKHSQVEGLVLYLIFINIELRKHGKLRVDINWEGYSFVARDFL